MISKKKYDLHFDLGKERNEEILNSEEEFEKFKENLKKKLSKNYNIPPEKNNCYLATKRKPKCASNISK